MEMDWPLFFSTYSLVFLAEFPDKTALATLMMATRNRAWPVFLGVATAFLIQSLVAVSCGSLLGKLPQEWVHWGAGILFLIFALAEWKKSLEKEDTDKPGDVAGSNSANFWKSSAKAFLVIFIAEWGDLTQLATATLAAKTAHPFTIFFAATLALWTATALVILLGKNIRGALPQRTMQRVAGLVFFCVGIYLIFWG